MSPGGGPILVVEDHPEMLDAVVTLLQHEGWTAIGTGNGEEAINRLNGGLRPSLVVIDLMLPKVSGWDLLQHLQETPGLREVPTLVLSGFPRESLRVTADIVLSKPVDYDRLVAAVRHLIDRPHRSPGNVG
jgi:CheY-like chemotaxis protein